MLSTCRLHEVWRYSNLLFNVTVVCFSPVWKACDTPDHYAHSWQRLRWFSWNKRHLSSRTQWRGTTRGLFNCRWTSSINRRRFNGENDQHVSEASGRLEGLLQFQMFHYSWIAQGPRTRHMCVQHFDFHLGLVSRSFSLMWIHTWCI